MKKLRIAFIVTVLAACVLPALLLACGFKNANRENRPLAEMPKLIDEDGLNLKFAKGFDKFMDDNFALREYLVTACNTVTVGALGDYNGKSAIIGREGTLLYSETSDDYLGVDLLSAEQISSAADYLAALQAELAQKGVALIFIAAPNKASVCPEYMPAYLKPVGGEGNLAALQAELDKKGVSCIDARGILLSAKQSTGRPVYYLRDSHWNNFGAALIYNAAAERLGLEAIDADTYTTAEDYTGDLVNFVYPSAPKYEERIIYTFPREYSTVDHQVNFDMFKVNETTSDANEMTLLVYHDSFGKSLHPFFASSVGRLVMLKSNSPVYDPADADKYGADAVIIELVERNLDLLCEYAAKNGY